MRSDFLPSSHNSSPKLQVRDRGSLSEAKQEAAGTASAGRPPNGKAPRTRSIFHHRVCRSNPSSRCSRFPRGCSVIVNPPLVNNRKMERLVPLRNIHMCIAVTASVTGHGPGPTAGGVVTADAAGGWIESGGDGETVGDQSAHLEQT